MEDTTDARFVLLCQSDLTDAMPSAFLLFFINILSMHSLHEIQDGWVRMLKGVALAR
jgi:hypothetical protein